MTALDAIRLHLATLSRGEYEYTTTNGTEHLVTTGAKGQWVNNQVVGHVGGVSAKDGGTAKGKSAGESLHEKSARLQREQGLPKEVRPGTDLQVLIHDPYHRYDPYANLDANFVHKLYGDAQMGAAMSRYTHGQLKEAADSVGVKPARSDAETISRITAKVTDGRYSANFPEISHHEALYGVPDTSKSPGKAAADPRSAAYLRDMAALKATHAAYLADHLEVAKAHDAATTKASKGGTTKNATSKVETTAVKLVPIADVPQSEFNPYQPPNPFALHRAFGSTQLTVAIGRFPLNTLRRIAKEYNIPTNGTGNNKDRLVQTIVAHVVATDGQRATVPDLQRLRSRFAALSMS